MTNTIGAAANTIADESNRDRTDNLIIVFEVAYLYAIKRTHEHNDTLSTKIAWNISALYLRHCIKMMESTHNWRDVVSYYGPKRVLRTMQQINARLFRIRLQYRWLIGDIIRQVNLIKAI